MGIIIFGLWVLGVVAIVSYEIGYFRGLWKGDRILKDSMEEILTELDTSREVSILRHFDA